MDVNQRNTKKFDAHALQTGILTAFLRGRVEVTIWLMNKAEPIVGRVKKIDTYCITVSDNNGMYHLLYKHGIAGFSAKAEIFKNMKIDEPQPEITEPVAISA